jgi:hypothetical protein
MLKRSFEKGTTVERLKITQRTVFHRAKNYVSGPEILLLGPEFPPLDKISRGQKFHNFWPFKIRLSSLQNTMVQRSVRGLEILVWQNFRGPEIP